MTVDDLEEISTLLLPLRDSLSRHIDPVFTFTRVAKHHRGDSHSQESEEAVPLVGTTSSSTQLQNNDGRKLLVFAFVAFLCARVNGDVSTAR